MTRATTDVPVTIENRDVTITVRAPTPPARMMLAASLPDVLLEAESDEEVMGALTLEELQTACEDLVYQTTDLPREVVEQLPGSALQRLAEAAADVIEADYRQEQRRARQFDQHMTGVPNDERVEAIFEFVAEDEGDLTDVSGVGPNKAEVLQEAGYETLADLRAADQSDLADVDGIGNALAARIKADVGNDEVEL